MPWEADELHIDPFTAIGDRREKNAVREAIERLPDAQQREVQSPPYVKGGASHREPGELIGVITPGSSEKANG